MRQAHDKDPRSVLPGIERSHHVLQGRSPNEVDSDVLSVINGLVQRIVRLR